MLGFIIEEGESRTQCDIICCFIHWPPGGALLRQRHSLINSGPHTGPLSRLFWECRRCTYYNPKLNPNLSSVCGMACSRSSALLSDHFNQHTISVVIIGFRHTSQYFAILLIFLPLSRLGRGFPTPALC